MIEILERILSNFNGYADTAHYRTWDHDTNIDMKRCEKAACSWTQEILRDIAIAAERCREIDVRN